MTRALSAIVLRWAVLVLSAALSMVASAGELPGAGKTVQPARATWDTGWFQTEIYMRALERLGYDVERPVTLDNQAFYAAVDRGEVDFWVNGWFPLHAALRKSRKRNSRVTGYVVRGGALQGYLVDRASAEEHGITGLEDLKRPAIRELFDRDDDGLAELVACPTGWGCEAVIDHHLKVYGLGNHVRPIKSDYSQSMIDAVERFRNRQPIFFYTWTPNWTLGLLRLGEDVVWIEVPFEALPGGNVGHENSTTVAGMAGCVTDPCAIGWPVNDIRPVVNEDFLIENPSAWRLFKAIAIPLADISAQNAKMIQGESSDEDIMSHADAWIAANSETFDGWISDANRASGCVALMKRAFGERAVERWSEICIPD